MALTTCFHHRDVMTQLGTVQTLRLASTQDGIQEKAHASGAGTSNHWPATGRRRRICCASFMCTECAECAKDSTRSGSRSLASRSVRAVAAWATRLEGFASCTPDAAAWVREQHQLGRKDWLYLLTFPMRIFLLCAHMAVDADTHAMLLWLVMCMVGRRCSSAEAIYALAHPALRLFGGRGRPRCDAPARRCPARRCAGPRTVRPLHY